MARCDGMAPKVGRATALLTLLLALVLAGAQRFDAASTLANLTQARLRLRSLAEGIETYQVTWGIYPYDGYNYAAGDGRYNYWYPPLELTTPLAFVDAASFQDPFRQSAPETLWQSRHIRYTSIESTWGTAWDALQTTPGSSVYLADARLEWGEYRLVSAGPDALFGPTTPPANWPGISNYPACNLPYDPTNGLESTGDLLRSQLSPVGYLNLPQESASGGWEVYR